MIPLGDRGQLPRCLLVTRNLPPLRGGMERLVARVAEVLSRENRLTVIGPSGCGLFLAHADAVREISTDSLPRFLVGALVACLSSRTSEFRIVFAGSGLTAPFAWVAARLNGAKSVVYLHGLDVVAPSILYQLLWMPFIRRMDLVLANSRNTAKLARGKNIADAKIKILHPGMAVPGSGDMDRDAFRKTHGIGARPVLLSVGRFTPRKGIVEFIRKGMPEILAIHPDALFLVVGADAENAARSARSSIRSQIVEAVRELDMGESVMMLPPCSDSDLSAAYEASDVHVFPVLDMPGDVEGFGMVAIEAAAHGLPTVAFNSGGVADAIMDGMSGSMARPEDYAGFARQVSGWLDVGRNAGTRKTCASSVEDFHWPSFDNKLGLLLKQLAAS